MSDEHTTQLAQRLGLAGPASEAEGDRVRLPDDAPDLPEWVPVQFERRPDATTPSTHAFVRPSDEGAGDVVLRIDAYELPSAGRAHDHLLSVLSEFQSPVLRVLKQADVGDVAVGHGDTAIVVRRANVVFVVRNAGRDVVPVLNVARTLDGAFR